MQNLQSLIVSGFNRGHDNSPGMDRTVSSLEWALTNIGNSGTACCYASDAAGSLEARLAAAYLIRSLALLNSCDNDGALREYERLRMMQSMSGDKEAFGGAQASAVNAALDEIEALLGQKRIAA